MGWDDISGVVVPLAFVLAMIFIIRVLKARDFKGVFGELMRRFLPESLGNVADDKSNRVKEGSKITQSSLMPHTVNHFLQETESILAIEEIPLDNRFGNSKFTSQHEFTRTATVTLHIENSYTLQGRISASIWSMIQAQAQAELAKTLGIEIGSQVTRRVNLTFEAAPGELVCYRIIWKQKRRHGNFDVQVATKTLRFPYSVVYNLYHSVESLSDTNLAN